MSDWMKKVAKYAGALLATIVALLIRQWLEQLGGGALPHYVVFYPIVMFVALLGGLGPGLTTTAAAALLAEIFILQPYGIGIEKFADAIGLVLFSSTGIIMSVVAERLRQAHSYLEQKVDERTEALREANEELAAANEELQSQTEELIASNEELRMADEGLRQSEERFRNIFDHAATGIAITDPSGRITQCNEAYCSLTGHSQAELAAMDFPVLIHLEDREQNMAFIRRLLDGELPSFEIENRYVHKNGSSIWVNKHVSLIRDDRGLPSHIIALVTDTTVRKLTENVFRFLGQSSASKSDEGFFQKLACYLAQTLNMDFVCIDRLEEDNLSAQTLAVFHNGQFEDNVSYTLQDTPCGDVVGKNICCFPRNVRRLFPMDEVLQDLQAESYLGTTLWSALGKPIGLIAVIGREPLQETSLAESILQLVAVRAAGELERLQDEEELRRAHGELEQRVAIRTEELALSVELLQGEVRERERVEESLQRLNRLYAVLSETDQAIVRGGDLDSMFREFCRIAVDEGGFLISWIGLVDEQTGLVKLNASSGNTGYLDDIRVSANDEPAGEGPTGIAIRKGTYYICNDFLNDPCTRPWQDRARRHGVRASASIALKRGGRVIGAYTLYSGEQGFFDSALGKLLQQLGEEISFALDNIEHVELRKEAERALQKETLERIQALQALRTKEQMMIQQSRQAAMGEMIGNIAHQWRQPLNVLGLILQELPLTYDMGGLTREALDASVAKGLQVISHMSRTIDGFRDFFRPDKEMVSFAPFNEVTRTISLVDASLLELQINVDISGRDDIIIHGYPHEYSQVILNILMNARDAFQERSSSAPRAIRISLTMENERSALTIADNAGGIPRDVMDKIFDPYFTTKEPDKGTGLGLFISKTIIEKNMNGRLSACNTGEGATFRIEV